MNEAAYYKEVKLVIDVKLREICKSPYYNHPKGCPNYGVKKGCPPQALLFHKIYDLSYPVYVIYNAFDLEAYAEKMRKVHPGWAFLSMHPGYEVNTCPEAIGVNVTQTMESIGILLEWPPVHKTYQVAIAGVRITP